MAPMIEEPKPAATGHLHGAPAPTELLPKKLAHSRPLFDPEILRRLIEERIRSVGVVMHRAAFLPESTAVASYGGVSNLKAGPALKEARRAKRSSGGRAAWRWEIEYLVARVRALVRGVVRWRPHVR